MYDSETSGMTSGRIKYNSSEINRILGLIKGRMSDVTTAVQQIEKAGNSALEATGGEKTDLGACINVLVKEDLSSKVKQAEQNLNNLIELIVNIDKEYNDANVELLNDVKRIIANAKNPTAPNPGTPVSQSEQ